MKRLLVCVALVGCGSDGGGDNGTIDIDSLGLELALASCSVQFECCTDAEIMASYMGLTFEGQPITTEQQCVDLGTAVFTSFGVTQYKKSIATGRMEYDGAAAADCVAAMNRLTCNDYNDSLDAIVAFGCRPFVLARTADGGACTEDYECITENCAGEDRDDNGNNIDGTCQPMPTDGQTCDDNCADGLYCGSDLTSSNTCRPLKANGAECLFDDECMTDHCDNDTDICGTEPLTCDGR